MLLSPAGLPVLLSRRARRSAARRRGNDGVWVLAFALTVLALIAGFFLVSGAIGGSSTCAKPLAPLGDLTPLSSGAFQQEDSRLALVVERAAAGDRTGAESAFYGEVHNFTHNVDKPLRQKDPALGKDLCRAVLDLEEALTSDISTISLSTKVERVRRILSDAAVALGFDRPR